MLLSRIELYLKVRKIPATRFGRDVLRDPNFVQNLRDGREPRRRTRERVNSYLDRQESVLS